LKNCAGSAYELLDLIYEMIIPAQRPVPYLPEGHSDRVLLPSDLVNGIKTEFFSRHNFDCTTMKVKEFPGNVQIGGYLQLDHLLLHLTCGIDVSDEMIQIFLGCAFKGIAKTIH